MSVSEQIDDTPAGTLTHGIMAVIAEFYSKNLSTEAKKGMAEKVRRGGTPGYAPLGYINTVARVDGVEIKGIVPDPERASHIVWAFTAYATGKWSVSTIRDELEARGLKSRKTKTLPGSPLNNSQVHRILSHPYYMGQVRFKGVLHEGKHEALVAPEMWHTVQSVLAALPVEDLKLRQAKLSVELADATRLIQGARQQTTDLLGRIEIVLGLLGNAYRLYAQHAVDAERQNLNEAMFTELRVDADDNPEANTSHPNIQQAPKSEVVAGVLLAGTGPVGRAQARNGDMAANGASGAEKGRDSKTPGKLSLTGGSNVTNLAERGGFEPPVDFEAYTAFRERHLQPLGHLSVPWYILTDNRVNDTSWLRLPPENDILTTCLNIRRTVAQHNQTTHSPSLP